MGVGPIDDIAWMITTPQELRARAQIAAHREGVSMRTFVTAALAQYVEAAEEQRGRPTESVVEHVKSKSVTPAVRACMDYIRQRLADGPVDATVMRAECHERGWSRNLARRAAQRVGVRYFRPPVFQAHFHWELASRD
jgi:hypothetical protein